MARIGPINDLHRVIFAATDTPQRAPSFRVPTGATVYVRAHNGKGAVVGPPAKAAGNADIIWIASDPDEALAKDGGSNQALAPNTQIGFPCTNLEQIWGMGTAGDGFTISILG